MDTVMPYVLAIVPTLGLFTLFYFVMKNVLEADRRERIAQRQWESEHGDVRIAPARIPTVPRIRLPEQAADGASDADADASASVQDSKHVATGAGSDTQS